MRLKAAFSITQPLLEMRLKAFSGAARCVEGLGAEAHKTAHALSLCFLLPPPYFSRFLRDYTVQLS
jgi:hypothetical protein